jgi:hypothetical protein
MGIVRAPPILPAATDPIFKEASKVFQAVIASEAKQSSWCREKRSWIASVRSQ